MKTLESLYWQYDMAYLTLEYLRSLRRDDRMSVPVSDIQATKAWIAYCQKRLVKLTTSKTIKQKTSIGE